MATLIETTDAQVCCDSEWEAAYRRFETPEQEIRKFVQRLRAFGAETWDREKQIVEIFCGRGNGLRALQEFGFERLEGVDLSAKLLEQYDGPAKCYVADCRKLPFDDCSRDILIVQGGLHHLPELPGDLQSVLSEVHRVLRPNGQFFVIEPWKTAFLQTVHFISNRSLMRMMSDKLDAFATMTEHELETYSQWLSHADTILNLLHRYFEPASQRITWGKLRFAGIRRA
ncbi:MAG: methyltransferase domain-containing protein [Planctomycetaceae bacterium]|nr:methyltransferase domain-containing protein [Planctomycetaceae bacterium]